MSNHQYRAFTIMELLVVSVISAITAAAVFSGIRVLERQLSAYQSEVRLELQLNQWQSQLQEDFAQAQSVYLQDRLLTMDFKDYSLIYRFEEEKVFRYPAEATDFGVASPQTWQYLIGYWQGEEVEMGKIDGLQLQTGEQDEALKYFIYRKISAAQKIAMANGH